MLSLEAKQPVKATSQKGTRRRSGGSVGKKTRKRTEGKYLGLTT